MNLHRFTYQDIEPHDTTYLEHHSETFSIACTGGSGNSTIHQIHAQVQSQGCKFDTAFAMFGERSASLASQR